MKVTAIQNIFDQQADTTRKVGDSWDTSEERAKELAEKGLVTIEEKQSKKIETKEEKKFD